MLEKRKGSKCLSNQVKFSTLEFDKLMSSLQSIGVAVAFNCYQCQYSKLPNIINGNENCVRQMDRIENSTVECKNSSQCQV